MPETQTDRADEVLTLAEAAAFLRTTEDALGKLAEEEAIPARQIGGQWRFLKRALADWLRYGGRHDHEFRRFPWFPEPMFEDFMLMVERHLRSRLSPPEENGPKPGSKEAVRQHFGVWRDDPTAEEMLEDIYRRRRGEAKE